MKERKLNYRFHNPNPTAATADYLLKIFMEANQEKVQLAIQEPQMGRMAPVKRTMGGTLHKRDAPFPIAIQSAT